MTTYKNEIIRLYEEGKSYRQIQKILGCSKGTIAYHLGAGQKEKTLQRQQKKRNAIATLIAEYKQEKGCADCKEKYPYWMLDFDHIRDKSFTISNHRMSTAKIDIIKKEIEKCEVVCANCHRNRTHFRQLTTGINSLDISQHYSLNLDVK